MLLGNVGLYVRPRVHWVETRELGLGAQDSLKQAVNRPLLDLPLSLIRQGVYFFLKVALHHKQVKLGEW
jgi:hypothetical protein